MKLLMIVGSVDNIFVYNLIKWLKKSMNIAIEVYELEHTEKKIYDIQYYDSCNYPSEPSFFQKLPLKLKAQFAPLWKNKKLKEYLKNKHYDVIHCHWLVSSLVISNNLNEYCNKLCVTFWGGEISHQQLFKSHMIYMCYLRKFVGKVDFVVNSTASIKKIYNVLPNYKGNFSHGRFGSSSIEHLVDLMKKETKKETKKNMGLPLHKKIVMIGYSGKPLHQHLPIIKALQKENGLKKKIHLFAPMTRDANYDYIKKVESALNDSGYTYTLLKNRYLTDEEVARVRVVTDIVFQFSLFDGFSRSILECICAKAILLYADWLNYSDSLDEFGFKAMSSSTIEEGVVQLNQIVDNFYMYEQIIEDNADKGKKLLLWSECIKDWITLYQSF